MTFKFLKNAIKKLEDKRFFGIIRNLLMFFVEVKLKNLIKNHKRFKKIFKKIELNLWYLLFIIKDVNLKNEYLALLKIFSKNKKLLAYLEDEILVELKGVQKFGTKTLQGKDFYYYYYPILGICEIGTITDLDFTLLNKRRSYMDLPDISEDIKNLHYNYGIILKNQIYK